MLKTLTPVALALALGGFAMTLVAQPSADTPKAAPTVDKAAQNAKVESLLAMPAAERRAHLKAMDPSERQGLWMQVKRAQAAARGAEVAKYREMKPQSLDVKPKAREKAANRGPIGTIQYDDNIITESFGGGAIIGNHFDTHGPGNMVFTSGSVATVVAVVVPGPAMTTSSAGFVLLGPQTGGGGAMAIFSTFTGATGTVDTLTFAGIGANYTQNDFFVLFGDFANSYVPAFGTGSNGQGHHGVVGYTGGMGPNITGTFDFGGSRNGLVRASGTILPVELMSFSVD